ncbi:hypothetical protein K450DRAFT_274613 [Umbelopsis ramanniana AG]|uniref:AMP-dependent synthetase/ligase domain-containing protein n=1 Tax=Umbelopsis ramanniana AG TaxID=1314678 RepID=A0AAD5E4L7_UMBRA|nr:uncharacterized protein K450DRAFT_274613 [Umbelopsis ramanniana AG]KAI8576589.1 hypothetical protein K450DRAFT_274613 [Umbelopsis ramanniana AG]
MQPNTSDLPKPTSFHQIFTYRSQDQPNHPWFYYPEPVNAEHYRELTFKGTDDLLNHLAAQYSVLLPKADESTISKTTPNSVPNPPVVVATLGSNTVQTLLTGLAAQRMHHAYMHISPLNSDAGILSLLESMDAKVLIADSVFYARAESLAAQIQGVHLVRMIEFDPVDELKKDLKPFDYDKTRDEGDDCSIIIHTSGTSSSAPKPIWHANKSFLAIPPFGVRKATITTGLLYHGMGGAVAIFAANIGASMALPLAKNPNHRTLSEVINSVKALPNANRLIIHPILAEAILETYGKNNSPELEYLRRLEEIGVGGGKLSSNVANELRGLGINVRSAIGSTEIGTYPLRNEPTKENWDAFVPTNDYHVKWEHIEGNHYELLVYDAPALALNLGIPKNGIFHTNDVFEESPPKSGKWVYVGRRDLMLIHSMGLNTNPVPWENALRPLQEIEECQLVGHGRRGPLLVVELNWNNVEDESKAHDSIWKAVEEYNKTVMAWSRVQHPEAVVILPRGYHLERCDKETVKRGVNVKKFEQEINRGYQNWDTAAPLAKA